MSARNLYSMIVNVANITNELGEVGMRLEIGDDFSVFRDLRNGQADRSGIYPMFDVACSYVDKSNAFWVCGYDSKGELVHTQAIRRLDLGAETLGEHLFVHRHKYITPNSTPDMNKTRYSALPALDRIHGQVCYHGEFWLKGGKDGYRSQGMTALLSRVVFEIALNIWSPDFVFGLVETVLAEKGAPVRYGYTHCEPGVWRGPNDEVTAEEVLVWMSREDMVQFLATPPKALSCERRLPMRGELGGPVAVVA